MSSFDERIKSRIKTTADWRREHQPHLQAGFDFIREPFEHPSGTWFCLCCPCGAKHLTHEEHVDQ